MFDVNMAASRAEICSGEGMLRRDRAKIGVQYEAHQFEDGTILFRCAFASALHGNLIVYRLTRFSILDNDMLIEVDNPTARWSEEGEKGEEARIAYCAPRAVRISFPERMAVQPARMEANLSNFSFGLLHEPPTPTTCTFVGREVDLVPVPNFIDTLKYLMAVSGVRQTSTLIIRDTANFTENLFSELISDILYPLTLCSSNRVSCKSYRAFDGDGGLIFACYEDARTALFTSNASSLGNSSTLGAKGNSTPMFLIPISVPASPNTRTALPAVPISRHVHCCVAPCSMQSRRFTAETTQLLTRN